MKRILFWALFVIALIIGYAIHRVDSRPTGDDAGITAASLIMASVFMGAAMPQWAWIWALAVGVWIPLMGIVHNGNLGNVLILGFAFFGAFAGAYSRKTLASLIDWTSCPGIEGNR